MSSAKYIIGSLVFAVIYVAIALGLKYAESVGAIGHDIVQRSTQVIFGLGLAVYANFMPKNIGSPGGFPDAPPRLVARGQAVLRVGGWCFLVASLVYAAAWAFAPLSIVNFIAIPAMLGAMAVTLGYAGWTIASCLSRTPSRGAS